MNQFQFETHHPKQTGQIELIIGPMFAGKSTELIRRVKRYKISGKKALNIKYSEDTRYSKENISTHDK
jgi:thymidine kinase